MEREYAAIADSLGKKEIAEDARREVAAMYDTLLQAGWDGDWFLRSYDAYGQKVELLRNVKRDRFSSSLRGFCVLAGVGVKEGRRSRRWTA